jgi:diguanylate cyclase (GGDEF)-like protein/PAS domain S-box-containing protein
MVDRPEHGDATTGEAVTPNIAELRRQLEQERDARRQAEEALDDALRMTAQREAALALAEQLALVGNWTWEVRTGQIRWSDQVHRIFGTDPSLPPEDFHTYVAMLHPEERHRVLAFLQDAVRQGTPYEVEHRIVRTDGVVRDVLSRGRAELGPDGAVIRIAGSIQDITDAKASSRSVQEARDLFAGVLDAATEQSIIATDAAGAITVFNSGAERMLGYQADEVRGTRPTSMIDPIEIAARAAELGVEPGFGVLSARVIEGRPDTRRWTYITKDGERLHVRVTVTAMRGSNGEEQGFILVGTNVTERMRAEAALNQTEARFQDTFEYAPNGMMLLDISPDRLGRFLKVNDALCHLLGYTEEELLGMRVADITHPEHLLAHQKRFRSLLEHRPTERAVERHWVHADGHDLWVQFAVSPKRGEQEPYVVGQVEDITARKQAEARLTHQALHDWLTGLPNRLLLMDRIEHAIAGARRSGRFVGVLFLDLDGFKAINDTIGHAAGDHALIEVANRLRRVVRPADTVARLGGDEFVLVCENLADVATATRIAERVVAALVPPHVQAAHTFTLGASVGVALSDHGSTPEQLLRDADAAMYLGKHSGKGRIRVSGADDPAALARSARANRMLRIETELRRALENNELVMYGQTVQDLRTGRVIAVENLIRWQHPAQGLLLPADFLDVAEAGDLMISIGRHVIRESCRMGATWLHALGDSSPDVHVNISGRQLEGGHLSTDVLDALHRSQLPPSKLVLELTETHMPLLADSLRRDIIELRTRGVKVAIDDLGTGYSSLTRITELPVDILKIDLSFVAGLETDPSCAAVVRGILAIGHALGLPVVAEGVETESQAKTLLAYGCNVAQGYLYSRPLPEFELLETLVNRRARPSLDFSASPDGHGDISTVSRRSADTGNDEVATEAQADRK